MSTDSARLQPPIVDPPGLRITGPQLVAVIKAMAEFAGPLAEVRDLANIAAVGWTRAHPEDPTWAELYEAQVAELAGHIGVLEIPGGDPVNDRFRLPDGSPNDVACPYCDAEPGETCRKFSGQRSSYPHSARWQVWRGHFYYRRRTRPENDE